MRNVLWLLYDVVTDPSPSMLLVRTILLALLFSLWMVYAFGQPVRGDRGAWRESRGVGPQVAANSVWAHTTGHTQGVAQKSDRL